jgi:hypothetical protein
MTTPDSKKEKSKQKPKENEATRDYKDPTGSNAENGKPKNSGYEEKHPRQK